MDARAVAAAHPLPGRLGTLFSVRDALRQGVSPSRLRAQDLDRTFWGVRAVRDEPIEVQHFSTRQLSDAECAALRTILLYVPRMAAHAFFSHESAARLWGVPLPSTSPDVVHVSVVAPHRAPRGDGVRGHRLHATGVTTRVRHGVPLASAATTWAQLAASLSLRDLVAAGDALITIPRDRSGRKRPAGAALARKSELVAAAAAVRRLGASKLRNALELVRVGSSSRPETHLRLDIADAALPEPTLDHDVFDGSGRKLGHSELAYPEHRIAIEYEGDHHRTSRQQWNRDIVKYESYAAAGWRVVRITSEHLYVRPGQAAERVASALRDAGWRP